MYIFIDESGSFVIPTNGKWSVCCLAALVFCDEEYPEIVKEFESLKSSWGEQEKEIKGRDLEERQIASVIQLLARHDVIFLPTTIDMGLQSLDGIQKHKEASVAGITKNITPAHSENLVKQLQSLQDKLRHLPEQLYIQFVMGSALIAEVLNIATLYYVQRRPQELGRFEWMVDAKDKSRTPYEDLWLNMICPVLMSKSLSSPVMLLKGADYSAFQGFIGVLPKVPEYLSKVVTDKGPFDYVDIGKLLETVHFKESREEPGLQLIDILCNALRRSMNGNLKREGWETLGCLMVGPERGKNVVHMIDLTATSSWVIKKGQAPYTAVVELTDKTANPMLSKKYLEEHRDG